jgi:CRP-like cAMP-binding protein
MDVRARLEEGRWFAGLGAGFADAIVAAGRVASFAQGQLIYAEGDEAAGLCLVIRGVLRMEASVGPERDVLIGLVDAGRVVGQSARFGGGRRIVTLRAQRDAQVLLVPDRVLAGIAAQVPEAWPGIVSLLYDQLDASVHLGAIALSLSPRRRVAIRLAQLAGADGDVPATQAEIGEMCGLSRKSAAGHVLALAARGWVEPGYRSLMVRDAAALRAFAGVPQARQ